MSKFLNISTDNTLGGNSASDNTVSSQKAVKDYVDNVASGKANDSDVVKLTGNQTVAGNKTFTGSTTFNNTSGIRVINPNQSVSSPENTQYGNVSYNDGSGTRICNMASITATWGIGAYFNLGSYASYKGFNILYRANTGKSGFGVDTDYMNIPAPTDDNTTSTQADTVGARNTKLANYVPTTRKINNKALSSDINLTASDVGALDYYGTCDTAAATQVKAVTCAGFVLATGATIRVKFTNYQNYDGSFKLNVNSTGDIEVKRYGTTNSAIYDFRAGQVVAFTYDGTYWLIEDTGLADTTYFGKTKLSESATSTSTDLALALKGLNSFAQNMISNAPVYSSSSTYAVGERVRYSYNTYVCKTAIETAESWTAAHWEALPDLQTQIDNISGGGDLVGTVKAFAGSTAPTGWLKCDGSAISRTTYSALFAVIGTTYGSGNGSTTFNLPNVKLQGGTISVLGNGKTLGITDGTNNFGLCGQVYLDSKLNANTAAYDKNAGATGLISGAGVTGGVGYGVVTSGESGLVVSSTQTVNAIIKY